MPFLVLRQLAEESQKGDPSTWRPDATEDIHVLS